MTTSTAPRAKATRPEIVKHITQRNAQMIRNDWLASPMGEYEYDILKIENPSEQSWLVSLAPAQPKYQVFRDAYTGSYTFKLIGRVNAAIMEPVEAICEKVDYREWTKHDIAEAIRRITELTPREEKRSTKAELIVVLESVA